MANASPTGQRPASKQDATSPAKPVANFRCGSVSAAIFAAQAKTKDGKTFDVHNVSVRRSYKKADGEWGSIHTLREADLVPASLALLQCHQFLNGADGTAEEERQ